MLTRVAWPANAPLFRIADKVVVLALTGLVTVLAPVAFLTELFASSARVPGSALAPAVHGVAGGLVVAVALMSAFRTERTDRTRFRTVLAHPTAPTPAFSVHVEAFSVILAFTASHAPATVRSFFARF